MAGIKRYFWWLALALGWGALGCGSPSTQPEPKVLRVAAASDLQAALPVLSEAFRYETRVTIVATFGASGTLSEQIKNGAPFDLFLSANLGFVEALARDGVVRADSVRAYALGSLALAVSKESSDVQSLSDLKKESVKTFALANPSFAPYGLAAKQALESAGLWTTLESKRVQASSVREALQFVESGNADAAFVGLSAVRESPSLRVVAIDPASYAPIVQGLGIVAASRSGSDAERFAGFLLGTSGQAILKAEGFGSAPESGPKTK